MTLLFNPIGAAGGLDRISQVFGVNPEQYKKDNLKGHHGIDLAIPEGTPVRSIGITEGKVWSSGQDYDDHPDPEMRRKRPLGTFCIVEHEPCEEWPQGYQTLYAHLSQKNVSTGDRVSPGQHIGLSGNTGRSTGPHLHFGIRPMPFDRDDGWLGFVDPMPYINWNKDPMPAYVSRYNPYREVQGLPSLDTGDKVDQLGKPSEYGDLDGAQEAKDRAQIGLPVTSTPIQPWPTPLPPIGSPLPKPVLPPPPAPSPYPDPVPEPAQHVFGKPAKPTSVLRRFSEKLEVKSHENATVDTAKTATSRTGKTAVGLLGLGMIGELLMQVFTDGSLLRIIALLPALVAAYDSGNLTAAQATVTPEAIETRVVIDEPALITVVNPTPVPPTPVPPTPVPAPPPETKVQIFEEVAVEPTPEPIVVEVMCLATVDAVSPFKIRALPDETAEINGYTHTGQNYCVQEVITLPNEQIWIRIRDRGYVAWQQNGYRSFDLESVVPG